MPENDDKQREDSKQEQSSDKKTASQDEKEQLETLLKAIKAMEEAKKRKGNKPSKRPKRLFAIEFGAIFHRHILVNFTFYFVLNLTIIYGIVELFGFGRFDTLVTLLLFVLTYTSLETMFRTYILMNHVKAVIRTFGFIFYFGYLTIFFIIDMYLFPNSVAFFNETLLVVFVGMFIVFRYLVTQLIKNFLTWQMGR